MASCPQNISKKAATESHSKYQSSMRGGSAVAICGFRATTMPENRATLSRADFRHGTASFKHSNRIPNHILNFL
jgi:hypothetical protein